MLEVDWKAAIAAPVLGFANAESLSEPNGR